MTVEVKSRVIEIDSSAADRQKHDTVLTELQDNMGGKQRQLRWPLACPSPVPVSWVIEDEDGQG